MSDAIDRLLATARWSAPGLEANAVLWAAQKHVEATEGRSSLYELVISPTAPDRWADLKGRLLCKLARLIEARGLSFPGRSSMLVGLWVDDGIHIFHCPELLAGVAALEEISLEQLRAQLVPSPLALPPPR